MDSPFRFRTACRLLSTTRPAVSHTRPSKPLVPRRYATHSSLGSSSSASKRKQISVASDDGRLRWGELTGREKAARATQQSGNFLIILLGAAMTGGVFTLLYMEVFAPDSRTWQFNRAVERVKNDSRCLELLGSSKKIKAYGETTANKWTRNRPIATTTHKDRLGQEHLNMNFHVSGPLNEGVVTLHMVKNNETHEFEYLVLALDVKGHERIYLENAEAAAKEAKKQTIFGIRWR